MLAARNLEVVYDDAVLALRGVSLEVPDKRVVALLGANGAGKTTLLRALTGLLGVHDAEVTKGTVSLDGDDLRRVRPEKIVRRGVRQVMEGRRVFVELSASRRTSASAPTPPGPRWPRTSSGSTACSPCSPTGAPRRPATSRAASSRCSPWAAP